jgi:hypothetical protein
MSQVNIFALLFVLAGSSVRQLVDEAKDEMD